MPYSLDLRTKVIGFIEKGGSNTKAAQVFQLFRTSIYRWLNRTDLQSTVVTHRQRRM